MQRLGLNAAAVLIKQELGTNGSTSGSYSVQRYWGVGAPPGRYTVCAYLLGPHGPNGEPGGTPEATASAALGTGAPPPPPGSSLFTLVDLRLQLKKRPNWHPNRPAVHSVQSGKEVYLFFYIRFHRTFYVHGNRSSETIVIKRNGRTIYTSTDPTVLAKTNIQVTPGGRLAESQALTFPHGAGTLAIVGRYSIEGLMRSRSTWVHVVG